MPNLVITNLSATDPVVINDLYLTLAPSAVSSAIFRPYSALPGMVDMIAKITSGAISVAYTSTSGETADVPGYPHQDAGGDFVFASYAAGAEPSSPEAGQVIWNTTGTCLRVYSGGSWTNLLGGAGHAFTDLTAGTNTNGAMVIGTGASLDVVNAGTINATTLNGTTFAAPAAIGSGTPAAGSFTTVTASTSARSPIVFGGTAAGSSLTLKATSGAGIGAESVIVAVGNNGGTTAATFDATGMQGAVGATTPATGAFTTVAASTSATSPLIVGGSGVGSDLTLQSTSGVGNGTDYVYVKVGNNGGTTAATFDGNGIQGIIGATTPAAGTFTTAVASTSARTPLVLGGTGVGSDLTLQSTSGVGDGTDYIYGKVGNNGGTTVFQAGAASFAVTGAISATTTATVPTVIGGSAVDADLVLQSTSGVGDGTDYIYGKVGNNGATTVFQAGAASFAVTGAISATTSITAGGAFIGTPEQKSTTNISSALSVATVTSMVTTDGGAHANAASLAVGTTGQVKVIVLSVLANGGDTLVVTPAAMLGGTTLHFTAAGHSATLVYDGGTSKWAVAALNGATIA